MAVKELCGTCGEQKTRRLFNLRVFFYSYASVSLTVNRDALLAGNALANVPRTIVKISQAITPLAPYTAGMGAVRIAVPTP